MWYLRVLFLCLLQIIPGADNLSITDEIFIKSTVDAHNLIRSKVTPAASNMKYMTWDSGLERIAKAWISKCIYKHNPDLEKVHPLFSVLGENLYNGPATNMTSITLAWASEDADYNYDTNGCIEGKKCGHYTQVVWAESYKVGCAASKCPNSYGFIVGCNYAPAGNYYGTKPYLTGAPCSGCPGDQCQNNLCKNPDRDKLLEYSNGFPSSSETSAKCKLPHMIVMASLCLLIYFIG